MDISYSRNNGKQFLVLKDGLELLPYEEQMLSGNTIPVLLQFYTIYENGRNQYWYEISGKESLKTMVETKGLSAKRMALIIDAIYHLYHTLANYLIPEERIFLSPETIFFSEKEGELVPAVCFFPHKEADAHEQLMAMMEYFLMHIDHADQGASELCYQLYEETLRDTVTPETLWEVVSDYRGKTGVNADAVDVMEYEPINARPYEKEAILEEKTKKEKADAISLDDVFDDEEDEEPTIVDRIEDFVCAIPGRLIGRIKGKKEEVFPPKDLEEDMIYDPGDDFEDAKLSEESYDPSARMQLIYSGKGSAPNYILESETMNIGSSAKENEIVIKSSIVSRHHAKIHHIQGKYYLEDVGSTNGTFLNGQEIVRQQKYELRDMDRIYFSNVPYIVQFGA